MTQATEFRCPTCNEKPRDVADGHDPFTVAMLDGEHTVSMTCAKGHLWLESALYTNGVAKRLRPFAVIRSRGIRMTGVKR